ncbi:MAG: ptsP [Burkholderiales bacterium]|nr:ptsP [Burkholderiales bacterium]
MQEEHVIDLYPPIIGVMMDIAQVPDQVFAEKTVGDGIAIDPLSNKIYAPVNGIIKSVHPSKHAIIIAADAGFDILIHIGLETVSLGGDGFNIHVDNGDWVGHGDVIGEFDLDYIAQCAKTLITPVVLLDLNREIFSHSVIPQTDTRPGFPIMHIKKKSVSGSDTKDQSQISNLIKSEPILILNPHGIHARPAAAISGVARKYDSEILIEKDDKLVNAKSIISILSLAVNQNDTVYVYAANSEIMNRLSYVLGHIYDSSRDEHKPQVPLQHVEGSRYYGIAASFGAACGVLVKRDCLTFVIEENATSILSEKNKFYEALSTVKQDIQYNLANLTSNDQLYSGILEAHIQMLCDPDFIKDCLSIINSNKSAGFAVNKVMENNCNLLANSKNLLLVERQDDFRDLRNRLLLAMKVVEVEAPKHNEPTILLADELTPTDLVRLDKNIVGLISVNGGATSHAAIIARARGIPLLIGVHDAILGTRDNTQVVLNCKDGYVNLAPDMAEIEQVKSYLSGLEQKHQIDMQNANEGAQTLDGHKVDCYINISDTADSGKLLQNGGTGIGLFRTEFIFLNRDTPPTVDEQYKIYADITSNIGDAPFIIRTLDAGGDKQIDYLDTTHEQNPVLGVRGIRLSLEHKDLLIDQLTAIAMVNKPNVKIMLPMISSIEEYRTVLHMFNEIKEQHGITADIELGIMVEVPSVALISSIFAEEVAFFSIGTNDLSQYILAIDRENSKLATRIDYLHPAVIRSIDMVVKGAKEFNRPVSVCGLMASDKLAIPLLIGMGIDQLSMSANLVAENKAFIRNLNFSGCVEAARHCLSLSSVSQIRQYLLDKFIN